MHRDAAEDRFAPEEREQDPRQAHEVSAPRCELVGADQRERDRDADRTRKDPVELLDEGVMGADR